VDGHLVLKQGLVDKRKVRHLSELIYSNLSYLDRTWRYNYKFKMLKIFITSA